MSLLRTLLAALLSAGLIASPAAADRPRDKARDQQREQARDADRAFEATQQGRSMPLPKIERRVIPFMDGADYLGPELNGSTYRLKFMRGGRVIWIDVDAATGRILRRSKP